MGDGPGEAATGLRAVGLHSNTTWWGGSSVPGSRLGRAAISSRKRGGDGLRLLSLAAIGRPAYARAARPGPEDRRPPAAPRPVGQRLRGLGPALRTAEWPTSAGKDVGETGSPGDGERRPCERRKSDSVGDPSGEPGEAPSSSAIRGWSVPAGTDSMISWTLDCMLVRLRRRRPKEPALMRPMSDMKESRSINP